MQQLGTYGITEYEVWNEPDQQWISGQDPETDTWIDDYVQLVRVTGEASQKVSDEIALILGAPSSNESLYEVGGWVYEAWQTVDRNITATSNYSG